MSLPLEVEHNLLKLDVCQSAIYMLAGVYPALPNLGTKYADVQDGSLSMIPLFHTLYDYLPD